MKFAQMMTCAVAIVVLVVATTASAVTINIYSEDFESATTTDTNNATYNWSTPPGLNVPGMPVNLNPATVTNTVAGGIDGNALESGAGTTARFQATGPGISGFDTTDPLAQEYELTFDAYVASGSGGPGWAGPSFFGSGNGAKTDFGLHYRRSGGTAGWTFHTADVGGGAETNPNGGAHLADREIQGTITIDLLNSEVRARLDSLADAQSHVFAPVAFTPALMDTIDGFMMFQDGLATGASTGSVVLDNINLTKTVPEPTTMGLLMLGLAGLTMLRRKR